MNILTTIPDSSISAWQTVVDKYNAGSGKTPVTIEGFAQVFRDEETARYVNAYNTAQITKLVPLGEKYNAATPAVQAKIDALLGQE